MALSNITLGSILLGTIGYFLWPAIILIYLGALVAFILHPLHTFLHERMKIWNAVSAILSVAMFVGIFYFLLVMILPALYSQLQIMTEKFSNFNLYTPSFLHQYFSTKQLNTYANLLKKSIVNNLDFIGSQAFNILSAQGTNIILFAGKFYLTILLGFFILKDWKRFNNTLNNFLPEKYSQPITKILADILQAMKMLIQGQTLIVFLLIIFYSTSFYLIGLPQPFLFGFFAGIASFIPYLGMIVVSMITLLYALNTNLEFYHLLSLMLTFVAGNSIEGSVLVPMFLSKKLNIHPVALIFYMIALGNLFGIGGVILALPTSVILNVLMKSVARNILSKN